jgi:hypothetical protein
MIEVMPVMVANDDDVGMGGGRGGACEEASEDEGKYDTLHIGDSLTG